MLNINHVIFAIIIFIILNSYLVKKNIENYTMFRMQDASRGGINMQSQVPQPRTQPVMQQFIDSASPSINPNAPPLSILNPRP
jgi:hypothetical protein